MTDQPTTLTDADLEVRTGRITGSRAPKIIMGKQMAAYLDIIGESDFGGEVSEPMEIGTEMEPGIIRIAARKLGLRAIKPPTVVHWDPAFDWAACSMDALLCPVDNVPLLEKAIGARTTLNSEEGRAAKKLTQGMHPDLRGLVQGLECKAHGSKRWLEYGQEGSGDVPEDVLVQCVWNMWVWDIRQMHVAPLIGGNVLSVPMFVVKRDEELEAAIVMKCEKFYREHVVPRKPPAMDSDDVTTRWIKKRFAEKGNGFIEPTDEFSDWVYRLDELKAQIKKLEEEKGTLENSIKNYIGEYEYAANDQYRTTWGWRSGRVKTDWQAIATERGATQGDIERHTSVGGSYRVLTTKWIKQ